MEIRIPNVVKTFLKAIAAIYRIGQVLKQIFGASICFERFVVKLQRSYLETENYKNIFWSSPDSSETCK